MTSKHREEDIFDHDEIRGVWIADETLSQVFDTSSQSKQKLRSKRRSKIIKIIKIIKITVVIFFVFHLT